jgi:hypothetical protein
MTATYEKIATTTASGSVSSITFNTISGSYTDLVLIIQATVASGGHNQELRFNGNSSSLYSVTRLAGNGSTATSSRLSNQTSIQIDTEGYLNQTIANRVISIQNYSNTTTNKTLIGRDNNASTGTGTFVGLWRSTSAITSIEVFAGSNYSNTSTFTLYGIKAE